MLAAVCLFQPLGRGRGSGPSHGRAGRTDARRRCEATGRREQWALWPLAGRFASLITDGDMPEENYICLWVARSLLGN